MRVETDDELYRVNAVWLGPPGGWPFPWRARYVAWGIGIAVFLLVLTVMRKVLDLPMGFFTVAWCLVITVALTRWIGSKIAHERPLSGVAALWWAELRAPRQRGQRRTSTPDTGHVAMRADRPRRRTPAPSSTITRRSRRTRTHD